ncbi:hypothetical protein [Streptomyces sp. NBC_01451]|uniref:hypothetical protein n=1 Tax=Streptomyces sp. NBC_01451 TaxID=2903872 RepID=UPI002E334789|nr:hypothetical protein [Streptomyces sp. NBC_01451]
MKTAIENSVRTQLRTHPWTPLHTLVITAVAAVPWLVAVLPLTLNGIQQVQESGDAQSGSVGLGIAMLVLAALPVVTSLLMVTVGLIIRLQLRKIVHFAAATLFFGGLASFLFAALLAMA